MGPNGDAHVYEPTPGDTRTLAAAAILIVNGLGLEGWMERLEKSSGFNGKVVTAAEGIKTRQMEEEKHGTTHKIADPQITDPQITDPHAWQSLANGRVCVQNIRDGLIAADPAGRDTYETNAARFSGGHRHGRNGRQGQYRQAAAGAPPDSPMTRSDISAQRRGWNASLRKA